MKKLLKKIDDTFNGLVNGANPNNFNFDAEEQKKWNQIFASFKYLIGYPCCKIFNVEQHQKNAFWHNKYYYTMLVNGTRRYNQNINSNIKQKIKEFGVCRYLIDQKYDNFVGYEKCYEYIKNTKDVLLSLKPYINENENIQVNVFGKTFNVKEVYGAIYVETMPGFEKFKTEGNSVFIPLMFIAEGFVKPQFANYLVEYVKYKNVYVNKKIGVENYKIKRSILKHQFSYELVDSDGKTSKRVKDIEEVSEALRNSNAHFSMYSYKLGEGTGRIIALDNQKAIVIPDAQFLLLANNSVILHKGMVNSFEFVVIHDYQKGDTEEAQKKFFNDIKILKLKTAKSYDYAYLNEIFEDINIRYNQLAIRNEDIITFFNRILSKDFDINGELSIHGINNYSILEARMKCNQLFIQRYNFSSTKSFMEIGTKFMIDEFYSRNFIQSNEKEKQEIKIKPCGTHTMLNKILGGAILKEDFNNAEIQAHAEYFATELAFAYAEFKIFTNLIYNGFLDSIKYKHTLTEVPNGDVANKVAMLDMSMFEIYSTKKKLTISKDNQKAKTLKSKIMILRMIRNSISHDNFLVQLSRSGNYNDSNLIFKNEFDNGLQVRVNYKKFMEFINNPTFVDEIDKQKMSIEVKDYSSLKKKVVELLKN